MFASFKKLLLNILNAIDGRVGRLVISTLNKSKIFLEKTAIT
jgi:hypothetical protein